MNNQEQGLSPPTVSIGMPVYNGEKYIREALDSLLVQSYSNFELIISDNSSIDRTEIICREYTQRDPRIRYVRQNENLGAIANFQFVLDEAVGLYFMWAAADDIWDIRWIETLLPISVACQCLAYGFVKSIDANSNEIIHLANHRKFIFTGNRFVRRLKYYMAPAFLGKANPIYGIFPIAILRELGISWIESEKYGGDMIFLYVLLDHIDIQHAGSVFLYKRIHSDCSGKSITNEIDKPNNIVRMLLFLKWLISLPMLRQYIRKSSLIQTIVLLAVYPFCVVYNKAYMVPQFLIMFRNKIIR